MVVAADGAEGPAREREIAVELPTEEKPYRFLTCCSQRQASINASHEQWTQAHHKGGDPVSYEAVTAALAVAGAVVAVLRAAGKL